MPVDSSIVKPAPEPLPPGPFDFDDPNIKVELEKNAPTAMGPNGPVVNQPNEHVSPRNLNVFQQIYKSAGKVVWYI